MPVELGGGSGTANGHWDEVEDGADPTGFVSNITGRDFEFELMTGWYEQTRKMPTPAVIKLCKLGDKVAKLLGAG